MKVRTFLAGGVLFLSTIAIGSAKSWDVVMESATKAGNLTLPAGAYHVKVDNQQAVFTQAGTGKKFTAPVKIQQAPKKFDQTAVETQQHGDQQVIQSIDLGGTTEMLEFDE